jgi:hypothetical protein
MSQKKSSTPRPSAASTIAPAYGSYNSYQLTDEQVKRALQAFEFVLLEGSDKDTLAGNLLVILRSFAYCQDDAKREAMLISAEEALMPYIGVVSEAIDRLSIRAHQAIIREGGTQ